MLTAAGSPPVRSPDPGAACPSGGQRDVAPAEPRRPHVDPHRPSASTSAGRVPATVCNRPGVCAGLARQQPATQRVALPQAPASEPSGLRMRMKASASRPGGRLDDDQLVAADAGAAVGDRRGPRRRQAERTRPLVEHDEVVPAAMHLYEARQHGPPYICRGPAAKVPSAKTAVMIDAPQRVLLGVAQDSHLRGHLEGDRRG